MAEGDIGPNALIGAVVTVLTTFTGLAPLLGGMVAGYLNRRDGPKVGALSGALATIPALLLWFVLGSLFAFLPVLGGGMMGPTMVGALGMVVVAFGFLFVLIYTIGLGALGGYLGVYLYREDVI